MNTDLFSLYNWPAVLVAAVAYFALGAFWYSGLFGRQWVAYHKINVEDPEMKKGVAGIMITSFILMLVAVVCIEMIVIRLHLSGAITGLRWGIMTGGGFAATAVSIGYLYTKKPLGLHLIDGLYHVCGHIVAAIILCVWQ